MTYGEAVRVAWFLIWRTYVVYLVCNFDTCFLIGRMIRWYFHSLWIAMPILLLTLAMIAFVVIRLAQWFALQLLRKKFRRFRVVAFSVGESEPIRRLKVWNTLKLWWVLTWRWWVLNGAVGAVIGGVYGMFFVSPGERASAIPVELGYVIGLLCWAQGTFLAVPWAVRVLVARPPRGFRIEVKPTADAVAT